MWRIEPVEEITIAIKSNPRESNHADYGAGGYINVPSIHLKDIGMTATSQETHRLRAKTDKKTATSNSPLLLMKKLFGLAIWSRRSFLRSMVQLGFEATTEALSFSFSLPINKRNEGQRNHVLNANGRARRS